LEEVVALETAISVQKIACDGYHPTIRSRSARMSATNFSHVRKIC